MSYCPSEELCAESKMVLPVMNYSQGYAHFPWQERLLRKALGKWITQSTCHKIASSSSNCQAACWLHWTHLMYNNLEGLGLGVFSHAIASDGKLSIYVIIQRPLVMKAKSHMLWCHLHALRPRHSHWAQDGWNQVAFFFFLQLVLFRWLY